VNIVNFRNFSLISYEDMLSISSYKLYKTRFVDIESRECDKEVVSLPNPREALHHGKRA